MIPVYVSNGAFITRSNGRDYRLIDLYPRMLDADGVEFLMYFVWKDEVKSLRSFLKNTRLRFPVTHMDKEIGEILSLHDEDCEGEALKIFERDLITALEIGSQKLVLHLWNGPKSDNEFSRSIGVYEKMFKLADAQGVTLTVENVTCVKNVCLDHLKRLYEIFPFAKFTYDTKMAHLHGENELLGSDNYSFLLTSGAINHLHVNDTKILPEMERLPIMHIGDGDVDFDSFFKLVRQSDFKGSATVESTSVNSDGSVDVERLNKSLLRVRENLNRSARQE